MWRLLGMSSSSNIDRNTSKITVVVAAWFACGMMAGSVKPARSGLECEMAGREAVRQKIEHALEFLAELGACLTFALSR